MKTNLIHARLTALAAFAAILAAGHASAQIIETDTLAANTGFTITTSNDLILNASPTSTAGDFTNSGALTGVSALTNGTFGNPFANDGPSAAGGVNDGSGVGQSATYSLGNSATGYSLSDVGVYSAWTDDGRYQQDWTISYSTVASPSTFLTLYTTPSAVGGTSGNNEARVVLTETGGGSLITGVADVKITFNNVANNWSGYRELVVDGAATPGGGGSVPEPSTWAMMFLGLAGLLAINRARRQSSL